MYDCQVINPTKLVQGTTRGETLCHLSLQYVIGLDLSVRILRLHKSNS